MAAPIMPFLRPLGLPKPSTIQRFMNLSFSTSARHAAPASQAAKDANFVASRTASAVYPPKTLTSLPRPKESRASRRTSWPRRERPYPTRQPSHDPLTSTTLNTTPITHLPAETSAPNLPYFVTRTPSAQLPIYLLNQRGGSLRLTRVKKISGSATTLRDELRDAFKLGDKDAVVNPITGHVVLKGHWKPQVERFLKERRF